MREIDPVTLEVIGANLSGIVREMQTSLFRTGFSTIIRESHDCSCALLDRDGRVVGIHGHTWIHLGIFPTSVSGLLQFYPHEEIQEGDAFLVNHPYYGSGTHVADVVVITPVFFEGELVAFCATMAHKSDLGGMVPGSCPGNSTEIYQEGLLMPPVRYMRAHLVVPELHRILCANSRTPDLVIGDIGGQIGTDRIGEQRMRSLLEKHGKETVLAAFTALMARTERRLRAALVEWKDGTGEGEALGDPELDHDGAQARVHVSVTKKGDAISFDFSNSGPQSANPMHALPPVVRATCWFGLLSMMGDRSTVFNHGFLAPVEILFKERTIVNPEMPTPVASYISALELVYEATIQALSNLTGKVVAGFGGRHSLSIAGTNPRTGRAFLQYEMGGGGFAAMQGKDGVTTLGFPVSSTCTLTPIEIIESEFPVRLVRFDLLPDSGGDGKYRGGAAYTREYVMLTDDIRYVNRLRGGYMVAAHGEAGGRPGQTRRIVVNPGTDREVSIRAAGAPVPLRAGDILHIESRGGGGVGDPREREAGKILEDIEDGYLTPARARDVYGIA